MLLDPTGRPSRARGVRPLRAPCARRSSAVRCRAHLPPWVGQQLESGAVGVAEVDRGLVDQVLDPGGLELAAQVLPLLVGDRDRQVVQRRRAPRRTDRGRVPAGRRRRAGCRCRCRRRSGWSRGSRDSRRSRSAGTRGPPGRMDGPPDVGADERKVVQAPRAALRSVGRLLQEVLPDPVPLGGNGLQVDRRHGVLSDTEEAVEELVPRAHGRRGRCRRSSDCTVVRTKLAGWNIAHVRVGSPWVLRPSGPRVMWVSPAFSPERMRTPSSIGLVSGPTFAVAVHSTKQSGTRRSAARRLRVHAACRCPRGCPSCARRSRPAGRPGRRRPAAGPCTCAGPGGPSPPRTGLPRSPASCPGQRAAAPARPRARCPERLGARVGQVDGHLGQRHRRRRVAVPAGGVEADEVGLRGVDQVPEDVAHRQ